jgi:hypothetical protein
MHDVTLHSNRVFVCREDGWTVVTTAIPTGNLRQLHVTLPLCKHVTLTLTDEPRSVKVHARCCIESRNRPPTVSRRGGPR